MAESHSTANVDPNAIDRRRLLIGAADRPNGCPEASVEGVFESLTGLELGLIGRGDLDRLPGARVAPL